MNPPTTLDRTKNLLQRPNSSRTLKTRAFRVFERDLIQRHCQIGTLRRAAWSADIPFEQLLAIDQRQHGDATDASDWSLHRLRMRRARSEGPFGFAGHLTGLDDVVAGEAISVPLDSLRTGSRFRSA